MHSAIEAHRTAACGGVKDEVSQKGCNRLSYSLRWAIVKNVRKQKQSNMAAIINSLFTQLIKVFLYK